jgi:hypothetical protein
MSQVERKKNPIVSAMKTMSMDEIPYRCFALSHEKRIGRIGPVRPLALAAPSCHLDAHPFRRAP